MADDSPIADATLRQQYPEYIWKWYPYTTDPRTGAPWVWMKDIREFGYTGGKDEIDVLYDLNFIGFRLMPNHYVNQELATRLIKAQMKLYDLAKSSAQKEAADNARESDPNAQVPTIETLDLNKWRAWCWAGTRNVLLMTDAETATGHGGLKDTPKRGVNNKGEPVAMGGGNGRHASGSAIDLHVPRNPYPPVRTTGSSGVRIGGEWQTNKRFKNHSLPKEKDLEMKQRGLNVYDRACQMYTGQPADPSPDLKRANIETSFLRFHLISNSLCIYFDKVYNRSGFRKGVGSSCSVDVFKSRINDALSENMIDADGTYFDPEPLTPDGQQFANRKFSDILSNTASGSEGDQFLNYLYNRIIDDFATMQYNSVSGSVILNDDGSLGFSDGQAVQRNPQDGILNLRQEVVVELVSGQGLRWGGCMFGNDVSGDMQHFDLDGHYVGTEKVADTQGPPKAKK